MKFIKYKYLFAVSFLTFIAFGIWILYYLDDEFINSPLKIKVKKGEVYIISKLNNLQIEDIKLQGEDCLIKEHFPIILNKEDKLQILLNCDAKSIEIETSQNIITYSLKD